MSRAKPYFIIFDNGLKRVEYRTHKPKGLSVVSALPAPIDPLTGFAERAEWLQIEAIDLPDLGMTNVVTIDQEEKSKILSSESTKKTQDIKTENSNRKNFNSSLKALRKLKTSELADLESIKDAFKKLIKFNIELEKRVINMEGEE